MTDTIKPTTDNQQPSTKILVFDNYDSFTYNLVQMIERITDQKVDVYRNDETSLEEIEKYDKIILSPDREFPKKPEFYWI